MTKIVQYECNICKTSPCFDDLVGIYKGLASHPKDDAATIHVCRKCASAAILYFERRDDNKKDLP